MRSIKLFLLAVIAVCFCTNVNAVELGDYMEIDGVPSIVIYVDATGEHGLVMSAVAPNSLGEKETKFAAAFSPMNRINAQKIFSSKNWQEYKNMARDEYGIERADFEAAYMELPTLDYFDYYNYTMSKSKKEFEKHLRNLAWQTTEFGKENAKVIRNYCEENDVDMKTFFPDQYWAESLGDGWFIPGNAEIELYADFLGQPIGFAYSKRFPFLAQDTTLWRFNIIPKRLLLGYDGSTGFTRHIFFAPVTIKTSTLYKSEWSLSEHNRRKFYNGSGKQPKIKQLYKDKKLNGFYRLIRLKKGPESNVTGLAYYYNDQSGYANGTLYVLTVAVKEF